MQTMVLWHACLGVSDRDGIWFYPGGNGLRQISRVPLVIALLTLVLVLPISIPRVLAQSQFSSTTEIQLSNPGVEDSTIAVDPHNSNYMFQSETSGGNMGLYSLDGGGSWLLPTTIPSGPGGARVGVNDDPSIAIDQNGKDYAILLAPVISNSTFFSGYAVQFMAYS